MSRRRPKSARFDPTDLFHLTDPDRRGFFYTLMGVVIEPEGAPHYELIQDNGSIVDVLVEVETQPDQFDLTCRLGSLAGGPGAGIWSVPPIGAEVAIICPNGKIDFQPTIIGILSTGQVPADVAEGVTVIANTQVLVHDGQGGAVALALKSDVQEVVDAINDAVPGASDGGAALQLSMKELLAASQTPTGTTILKGK